MHPPFVRLHRNSLGHAVLEVYSDWCGPCKSVLPTLKRIKLDKDDEAALQFLTVSDYA